jgi:hypothetical protein
VSTQLHRAAGARVEGEALVCATPDVDLRIWMAGDAGQALLAELVSALTGGSVRRVVPRLPGEVERTVEGGEER